MIAASMGPFSSDDPTGRVIFVFHLWMDDDRYQLGFIGQEKSPWQSGPLGTVLEPVEARRHLLLGELYQLIEIILERDEVLTAQIR
jgi:hypothetical protein